MKKSLVMVAALVSAAFIMGVTSCSKKESAPANTPAEEAPKAEESAAEAPKAAVPEAALKNITGIYLSANDLNKGELADVLNAEDGFVINASAEKIVAIEEPSEAVTVGDDVFTKRISTKGSGKTDFRNIAFPAKKDDSIIIWCAQGGSSNRPLHVADMATGNDIAEFSMDPKEGKTIIANVFEAKAPADGNYCVYSTSGGCYIFQIKVGK